MTIHIRQDEQLKVLETLEHLLEYAKSNAEELDDPPLVKAIEDARSIAQFSKRRRMG